MGPIEPAAGQGLSFPKGKGKIALVLDDWGYSTRHLPALASLKGRVTVAVLPGLAHSAAVGRTARRRGHEVILHMPMEAMDPESPREKGTLLAGMSAEEISHRLEEALATVPGASGISNHQGSRVTSDPAAMQAILQEAKRRGLYFLDSLVTDQSVCRQVSEQVRVRFAQRAVFLDNDSSQVAIRARLVELAETAAKNGRAIGIGHDRPATIEALQRAIPALEQAGYTLAPVSELVEKER